MAERVEALDLGVKWDPNAPEAVLITDDHGKTVLALNAEFGGKDSRSVVLTWTGTRSACLSDPNDEAISGHRLYKKGLEAVLWAGVVQDSERIQELEQQNAAHPHHDAARFQSLAHHVLPLKECVVEVVANDVTVSRSNRSTLEAAAAAMR